MTYNSDRADKLSLPIFSKHQILMRFLPQSTVIGHLSLYIGYLNEFDSTSCLKSPGITKGDLHK